MLLPAELLIWFLIFYTYKCLQRKPVFLSFSYINEDMFYNKRFIFHYNSYDTILNWIYLQRINLCQSSKEIDLMKYYNCLEIIT